MSIESRQLAMTRINWWASSKAVSQAANFSRSTTSTVSATTVAPLGATGGRHRLEPACIAAGQASATPGGRIVERQRLADAARGAGVTMLEKLFMG